MNPVLLRGVLGAALVLILSIAAAAEPPPEFLYMWGSPGSGNGQFGAVNDVAIGPNGYVYVCEPEMSERVQVFDADGNYLFQWGGWGSGAGQFVTPTGIDCDDAGHVFVVESRGNRVQKFEANGAYIKQWSLPSFGDYGGLAVAPDGAVYVAHPTAARVLKFDNDGNYLMDLPGPFQYPGAVECDASGNVYVASAPTIRKYSPTGAFVLAWGTSGSGPGQFSRIQGIGAGPDGAIYVSDMDQARIQKFDSSGNFLCTWGTSGNGPGQFSYPRGIAVHTDGRIYVADKYNNRIQVFKERPVGIEPTSWGAFKILMGGGLEASRR